MSTPQRSDYGHFLQIPTRWGDLDALGHVNNTNFFVFDESVRLDYFGMFSRDNPRFWKEEGLILANLGCDFVAQLHHPSVVDAGFRIARLGRSSMKTEAGMFVGDKLVAVTRGTLVWFDYTQQKPAPIPEYVRAGIRGRERIAPEEG
jgi:acyl-CoA thioester hydrolase